jgi:hypothetical protein
MQIIIEVSTPSALAILPIFPVEVAVGTQLHAAVTFKTSNGDYHDMGLLIHDLKALISSLFVSKLSCSF